MKLKAYQDIIHNLFQGSEGSTDELEGLILETSAFSKKDRIMVYRFAHQQRLRKALESDFPLLHGFWYRFLTKEEWCALCDAYQKAHSSMSYTLSDYGAGLADFLRGQPQCERYPYLVELARLEWAFEEAFYSAPLQVGPQEWPRLLEAESETLKLQAASSLRFLEFKYPVDQLLDGDWEKFEGLAPEENYGVVYQDGHKSRTRYQRLEKEEWELLRSLLAPASLAELVDRVDQVGYSADEVRAKFEKWTRSGWLDRYE